MILVQHHAPGSDLDSAIQRPPNFRIQKAKPPRLPLLPPSGSWMPLTRRWATTTRPRGRAGVDRQRMRRGNNKATTPSPIFVFRFLLRVPENSRHKMTRSCFTEHLQVNLLEGTAGVLRHDQASRKLAKSYVAMGHNPVLPVNIRIPTKTNYGEFTYIPTKMGSHWF